MRLQQTAIGSSVYRLAIELQPRSQALSSAHLPFLELLRARAGRV